MNLFSKDIFKNINNVLKKLLYFSVKIKKELYKIDFINEIINYFKAYEYLIFFTNRLT